jgi:hypothetical protein
VEILVRRAALKRSQATPATRNGETVCEEKLSASFFDVADEVVTVMGTREYA